MLPTKYLRRFANFRFSASSLPAHLVVAAVVIGPLLTAVPVQAQYMYLDSNGDGVHTAADVITATGTTQAKIYLRTNKRRDGSDAICPSGAEYTINSYEASLRAVGGSVVFSNATNLMVTMGTKFGNQGNAQEYYIGYAGTLMAPGDYLLAQIEITVASGSPSIEIVPSAPTIFAYSLTSFGSRCEGNDYDNTQKLGSDWFDADGLGYSAGGGAGDAPLVSGPASLVVRTGEPGSADFAATDANGDLLTLSVGGAPGFVRVARLTSSPGNSALRVHAFPLRGDAGSHDVTVSASDGFHTSTTLLHIEIQTGSDHAPALRAVAPVRVVVGTVASLPLVATDSDGDPATFRIVSGPDFAELASYGSGPSSTAGRIWLRPGICDAGSYNLEIGAVSRDGEARLQVHLDVLPGSAPPSPMVRQFGANPSGLASADFNEDGKVDVASVNESGPSRVAVFLGDGAGSLALAWERQVGDLYWVAESADWNGDGHADLAIGSFVGAPLLLYWGHGDGTFSEATAYDEIHSLNEIRAGDLNSDGVADLVACGLSTEIAVLMGASGQLPGPIHKVISGEAEFDLAIGDLDRDGRLDLILSQARDVRVFYGFGDGTFGSERSIWPGGSGYGLVTGDWNEDGILDIAATRSYTTGSLVILTGNSAGGFDAALQGASSPYGYEAVSGDWNGDGHLDLLVALEASSFQVLLGTGSGAFALSAPIAAGIGSTDVLFADLNADGRPDVVTAGGLTTVLNNTPSTPQALARAFTSQSQRAIPAAQSSGTMCVRLEALDGGFTPGDIDPTTLRLVSMGTGSVSEISATMAKSAVIGDSDKNDVPEYPACFAMSDASALFSLLRGKQEVPVRLEGGLTDGRRFCSRFTIPIIGKGSGAIAARVEPNPLNPEGTLRFTAKAPGAVTIRLFDVSGRLVRSVWNARATVPGSQEARIDGKDASGRALRSGVYFYRIEGAGLTETGRFTILR